MKDQEYIIIRGRKYHYDADFDTYYPYYDYSQMSTWNKYSPVIVLALLLIVALAVS